jgi:MoaA/NifB/PqqE/SkfB family radical SAM enzyme
MSCPACSPGDASCHNAFARAGIFAAHWECWSDCNLDCEFCYRSMTTPTDTGGGLRLINTLAFAGIKRLILAGGDPSLRRDLGVLCRHASSRSLQCELQTNAQVLTPSLRAALPYVSRLYVSIDGASASVHDEFRSRPGNFIRIHRLMRLARDLGIPVTVHSVASKPNLTEIPKIHDLITRFTNVDTWSVLEFSPIGNGFKNKVRYSISQEEWSSLLLTLSVLDEGAIRISTLGVSEKQSLYALVSSDGVAYRAGDPEIGLLADAHKVGSLFKHHLVDIACKWRVDEERHGVRYHL